MKMFHRVLLVATCMTFVLACSENQFNDEALPPKGLASARVGAEGAEDRCATMKVLKDKMAENPGLERAMEEIEDHTKRFIAQQKEQKGGSSQKGTSAGGSSTSGSGTTDPAKTITIPVYVHVVYNTAQQNISNAQIQSQISFLNQDFRATNPDKSGTPSEFAPLVDDLNIQFTWNTSNLVRKSSSKTSWGTNDSVKKANRGGSNPVPGFLNIWICNIGGGILGYAQFPGGSAATDGIVVGPQYFGSRALAAGYYAAPFDLGRTATHEVGHWLNLRHIWGDGGCGVDDFVADTPVSDSPNYGCPTNTVIKCGNRNMTMNFMDYTDDKCMYMFTTGQKSRSRAIFAPGGPRAAFVPAS